MFYNLLDFPEALPANRSTILKDILNEYDPDIFMVCELQTVEGANALLNVSLNDEGFNYLNAPFVENQSGLSELQQLIFFKKKKFSLVSSEIIRTFVRDINRYTLQAKTTDEETNPLKIEIFVTHLKASTGNQNEIKRLQMVQEFTEKLETLDPNSFVIFAGDLNLYTSAEPAYQELLDPTNAIKMVDPINTPGDWHNNSSFQAVHTQSTRISSGPFNAGSGGGMDDRFDFILISENMLNNPKLRYIEDSYKTVGNNGNCFNNSVNSEDCSGVFSETLRENLYNMSDHLPVFMELETNQDIVLSNTGFVTNENQIQLENTLVTTFLTVHLNESISEKTQLTIYNVLGQKVYERTIYPSEKRIDIAVPNLSNGIYYLKSNLVKKPLKFIKTS